jgi:ribose/xylose/arabinose/galactoside ABC-type transport system permease subunit
MKELNVNSVAANKNRYSLIKFLNIILLIVILIVTIIFFTIKNHDFLSVSNIITIIIAISTIGIVCIGQTMLLISGTFDISVGSVVGFAGVVLAKLLGVFKIQSNFSSVLMVLLIIAVGLMIGFINGIIVTKVKVNALITTIAMLSIVIGFSMVITKAKYIAITTPFFIALGNKNLGGLIPIPLIILVVLYIVFYFILKSTVFGRYVYAIGNNETAARYAGIKVDRIRIILFMIASATAAIAGIILASKLTSAQAIFGENYPLTTIAACVMGGTALTGGKGGVIGSLLGISFLAVLSNGLVLIGLPTHFQNLVTGIILIIALYISETWVRKV